jgi:hypothetical protein
LIISGKIEKFFLLSPSHVRLEGLVGKQIKRILTITPEEKYPFKIVKASVKTGKYIRFNLKEVKKSKKAVYLLSVENLRKEKGRYYDMIFLKTDNRLLPDIRVRVLGNITYLSPKGNKPK